MTQYEPRRSRGRPTLPRLVSGARNFLNCKTPKWCGRCTRWPARPTLGHEEPFITHEAGGRLCHLQKANKSRRNVFARLCEAKSRCKLTAQKGDCIPGRDDSYAGSGWAKGSFAISPPPPSSRLQLTYHLPHCLTRGWRLFSKGIFIGVRTTCCFLPFELVLARGKPELNLFASQALNPKVSALLACARFQELLFQNGQTVQNLVPDSKKKQKIKDNYM